MSEFSAPETTYAVYLERLASPAATPASDTRAAVPDGFVLMPRRLTAENGAKGAFSGEFKESIRVTCPECDGSGEIDDEIECGQCDGEGTVEQLVLVGWDTIKDIYKRAVGLLAAPAAAAAPTPADDAKDAAQYRWLRECGQEFENLSIMDACGGIIPEALDDAIDRAAMSSSQQDTKGGDENG
jgi:hypothetical protein